MLLSISWRGCPMNYTEIFVFVIYLACMIGVGIWFFIKDKNGGEKTYFLGGREMGPWCWSWIYRIVAY